jgi:hypothetical protein
VTNILCQTEALFSYNVAIPANTVAVTATAWVKPTLSTYQLVSPQNGGCDAAGCDAGYLNGTATATARNGLSLTSIFRNPAANSGVRYLTVASIDGTTGASDFNTDTVATIFAAVGGTISGFWSPTKTLASGSTLAPINQALSVSAQITQTPSQSPRVVQIDESAFGGATMTGSVTLNAGSADVTPPTCSLATIAPLTFTTMDISLTGTLTVTCTDGVGGSGVWYKGAFLQGTVTNGPGTSTTIPTQVSGGEGLGTATIGVPPYVSGNVAIIGVFAVDNAGNSVVYGSCGNAEGYDSMGCAGGGSSGASTVAISMFSLVFLAVYALFA